MSTLKDNEFILGIDIGDCTSTIAFYDNKKNTAQVLDFSGGYGRVTTYTAMQYIKESDEWIFGEHALSTYIENSEVISRPFSQGSQNWEIFIDDFLLTVKNINPKAKLVSIVVAITEFEDTKILKSAFKRYAGITTFVPYNKCIFSFNYFNKKISEEKVLLLDYGARSFRGGVYDIKNPILQQVHFKDKALGTHSLSKILENYFIDFYKSYKNQTSITEEESFNLKVFANQSSDQIFLKKGKQVRLYLNFCYPQITCIISERTIKDLLYDYEQNIKNLIKKSIDNFGQDISDIETVLLTGGGFEMAFAKSLVEDILPDSNIVKQRGTKVMAALGACIIGATNLKVVSQTIEIKESEKLGYDIGLYTVSGNKNVFVPIILSDTFLPNVSYSKDVLVTSNTNNPFSIDIIKRDKSGELSLLSVLDIDPISRPSGTTCLSITLNSINEKLVATVVDKGFGDIFAATDFKRKYILQKEPT